MKREKFSDELVIAATQSIEEENFWLNEFTGELTKCYFPHDYTRNVKHERKMDVVESVFSKEMFSRLMELSNNSDVRLFIIMVTGIVLLLPKYTPHKDIILGTSIYKQQEEFDFINTVLPLRNHVEETTTFKESLMQVGKVIFGANKHQNYPIETLLHLLDMPFLDKEDFPLFDIAILFDNIHDKKYLQHINLNIIFIFKKTHEGIEIKVEYNSYLYKKTTIERIVSHYMNLLKNAVFNINGQVSTIEMLSEKEKKEILFDFNDTKSGYSRDKTMHQLFEERVQRVPGHIALIFDGKTLSYQELNEKTNRLARELRKRGVKINRFVAVVMDRSIEMVISVMAILKAGGAYVPIEPYLPESRIRTCLAAVDTEYLLTNRLQLRKLVEISKTIPGLKNIFVLDIFDINEIMNIQSKNEWGNLPKDKTWIVNEEIEKNPAGNPEPAATAGDIAYVIFTSGTTGTPKGVVEQHRPVVNLIEWVNNTYHIGELDKILFVASLSFDLSVYDIFGILGSGASVRVVSSSDLKLPDRLLDIIFEEGITFWDSAPAALQQLVPYIQELKETRYYSNKSKLRLVFLSGDWIPVTLPDILKEAFDDLQVISLGGGTEATIWSNYYPIEKVDPGWNSIPYGKPIRNAKYYILDRSLNPFPIGIIGDLYIGGECLSSGYINDMELTAQKFVDNPFAAGEKIYRTGDLARWFPDGNMEFMGRQDNQVKIRGFRIELGDIESQLLKHEDIKEVVVAARDGKTKTKSDKYLCAYYVSDREFTPQEFSTYLSGTLPEYMIPLSFVKLGKMPVTPNGKLDRKALPEPGSLIAAEEYIAPRNKVEEKIVEIWSELLGIEKEKIGINANFFELGGHSLNATIMTTNLHKELNVKIPLLEIFTNPIVRNLSKYIESASKEIFAAIQPIEKKEYYPLSSAQNRLYILQRMDLESTAYNVLMVLELEGDVDKKKLEETFRKLLDRHESLRTSFILLENSPVQRIHQKIEFEIEYYGGWDSQVEGQVKSEEIIKNFNCHFDLAKAPLLRVGLIKMNHLKRVLMADLHHIITDMISQEILMNDFMSLYNNIQLPGLRLQYKNYSVWQQSNAVKEALKRQEEFWLREFAQEAPILNMPTDYLRPPIQSFEGKSAAFEIDEGQTKALMEMVHLEGATLFMVLLAIYYIFLSKISSQEDIVVGTPIASRRHADLEKIIGMFTNTLALRNRLPGEKTFKRFFRELRERTLEAFENQDYLFEDLVDKVAVKRDMSRNPLFDVMLVLYSRLVSSGETGKKEWNDLKIKPYPYEQSISKFDFTVSTYERGEKLYFSIEYCSKLFKSETIERFINYFKKIISSVIENPGQKMSEIEIISEEEKNRILYEFNDTRSFYPKDKTIHQLFEEQVERTPDNIAVVGSSLSLKENHLTSFENVNASPLFVQLSYNDLEEKANRLAHELQTKGVDPDTIVGIMAERSIEMVMAILAVWKAGGAYMPIDKDNPLERLIIVLGDSAAKILLASSVSFSDLHQYYEKICIHTDVEHIIYLDKQDHIQQHNNLFRTFGLASLLGKALDIKPGKEQVLHYKNQSLKPNEYMYEVRQLSQFILSRSLNTKSPVAVMVTNPIYKIIALLSLKVLHIPFIVLAPHLSGAWKKKIITDSRVKTVFSQQNFLDELDSWLWEADTFENYVILDRCDFRQSPKVAGVKKIWNYVAEESSEAINDYGWSNSYTGEPFSIEEMNEYSRNFKMKLKPFLTPRSKVLEIGCGHGLVLFEIAPVVAYYYATDLSEIIIEKNRKRLQREAVHNVKLKAAAASEIDTLGEKGFDIVICSSVVHYFPNSLYLEKVIKSAVDVLKDQGIIYLDDLMNLSKKEELIRSTLEFKKSNPEARVKTEWDGDLFVSESFFHDLREKYAEIVQWESSSKLGVIENELTRFRYDVILKINKKIKTTKPGICKKNRYTPEDIEKYAKVPASIPPGLVFEVETGEGTAANALPAKKSIGDVMDISSMETYSTQHLEQPNHPADLAYVIYTSGSTGRPKGAVVEHRGMMNHMQAKIKDLQLKDTTIVAQNASHTFDISVWQFFAALLVRGKTVIFPEEIILEPVNFLHRLVKNGITILEVVPSYLSVLLEYVKENHLVPLPLKYLLVTGEEIKSGLAKKWFEYYPHIKMINAYGPTEASDDITHYIIDKAPGVDPVPIGKPVQNLNIYIVDSNMRLCPLGLKGEICVSGVGVGRGYLNDTTRTHQVFTRDLFVTMKGVRLYKTGDIGRWLLGGVIEFLGRKDHQVKIRGYRIELGEIQSQLLKQDNIKDAVAVARGKGEAEKYLCAYVVTAAEIDIPAIKKNLLEVLPDYMIPTYFVQMEKIPLTPNGKIDQKSLPEPGTGLSPEENSRPPNGVEEKLMVIWSEIVGKVKDKIGIEQNLFELGGNSLNLITLVAKVHQEFGIELPVAKILDNPTIKEIARKIESKNFSDSPVALLNSPAKKKLFLFPPQLPYGVFYIPLAMIIPDYSFYAFSFIEEEDRLDQYVRLITNLQPEGPYILFGYSAAGRLTFQVAKALENRGYEVSDIIFIECFFIEGQAPIIDEEFLKRNRESMAEYMDRWGLPFLKEKVIKKSGNYMKYIGSIDHLEKINTTVHLLLTEQFRNSENGPDQKCWDIVSSKTSLLYNGFGTHRVVFDPGYVEKNAEVIRKILDRIESGRSPDK